MSKELDPKEQERAAKLHAEFIRKERGAQNRLVEVDGVAHADSRDIRKRILDAGRTYPKKQIGSTLEQQIAEREREIAAEKFQAKLNDKNLSIKERELLIWKRANEAELDAKEQAERVEAFKQLPRTVKRLTEAKLLREKIVNDSTRELAEIEFADLAIAALSDPDADDSAATALLVQLRESEKARIDQLKMERQAKIAGLQNEIAALEQQSVTPIEDDLDARAAEREAATQAKFEKRAAEQQERKAQADKLVSEGRYQEALSVLTGETANA